MIIYNVTSNIDNSIHDQWLTWMKEEHIPQVLATGKFEKATLVKVLVEDDDGVTYSVQYKSNSREALEDYYNEDAPKLRADGFKRFGDKVLSFRTELQIIDEYSVSVK